MLPLSALLWPDIPFIQTSTIRSRLSPSSASSSRPLFFAPSGEGLRNYWCEAPFGPFRQMVPDTLRPPYPCAPQPDDREPHDARPHVLVPPCKGRPIGHTDVEEVEQSDEIEGEQERKADQHADQPLGPPDRIGQHRCAVEEHGQEPDATVRDLIREPVRMRNDRRRADGLDPHPVQQGNRHLDGRQDQRFEWRAYDLLAI